MEMITAGAQKIIITNEECVLFYDISLTVSDLISA
jgi:hypothetical protein